MNATLVATIGKNKLEEIRISLLRNNKIDVRTYFYFQNDPAPKPTKKGIWLSFKHIPPILAAFAKYDEGAATGFKLEFEVPDRRKEKIRVYVNEYMGGKVIHIRTFYLKENEFNPGKGVSFAASLLPKMIEGLAALEKFKG
jgi:hypothetical protein